jgi:hypothetical protein
MRLGLYLLGASAVTLAACNAIVGFADFERLEDPDAGQREAGPQPPNDGGLDADVASDARCNPLARFSTPTLARGLNDADSGISQEAVLSPDELEVFLVRTDNASVKTFLHGRRTERMLPWEAAKLVSEPLNVMPTSSLSLAAGGLHLYFHSSGSPNNFVASRVATSARFPAAVPFDAPESIFVSPSDTTVYGRLLIDGGDSVVGRGTNTGTTSTDLEAVPNLHVAGASDVRPVVNASETRLYFTSIRVAAPLLKGEIYVAARASKAGEFGAPVRVDELSSTADDVVTWVSDDDCEILVVRDDGVYGARRPR